MSKLGERGKWADILRLGRYSSAGHSLTIFKCRAQSCVSQYTLFIVTVYGGGEGGGHYKRLIYGNLVFAADTMLSKNFFRGR